jgi:hypothetical protein
MSTSYITTDPMTIDAAIQRSGRKLFKKDGEVQIITDEQNYAHCNEITLADGQIYVEVDRFGANDVEDLVELLDLISEHDDEYFTKLGFEE